MLLYVITKAVSLRAWGKRQSWRQRCLIVQTQIKRKVSVTPKKDTMNTQNNRRLKWYFKDTITIWKNITKTLWPLLSFDIQFFILWKFYFYLKIISRKYGSKNFRRICRIINARYMLSRNGDKISLSALSDWLIMRLMLPCSNTFMWLHRLF